MRQLELIVVVVVVILASGSPQGRLGEASANPSVPPEVSGQATEPESVLVNSGYVISSGRDLDGPFWLVATDSIFTINDVVVTQIHPASQIEEDSTSTVSKRFSLQSAIREEIAAECDKGEDRTTLVEVAAARYRASSLVDSARVMTGSVAIWWNGALGLEVVPIGCPDRSLPPQDNLTGSQVRNQMHQYARLLESGGLILLHRSNWLVPRTRVPEIRAEIAEARRLSPSKLREAWHDKKLPLKVAEEINRAAATPSK